MLLFDPISTVIIHGKERDWVKQREASAKPPTFAAAITLSRGGWSASVMEDMGTVKTCVDSKSTSTKVKCLLNFPQ